MDRYDEYGNLKDLAHKEDHYFIDKLKEKQKQANETKEKVKASLISSILIAITVGAAGFIWNVVMEVLRGQK